MSRHGLERSVLKQFEADASPRRYYRVQGEGILLMEDRQDQVGFAAYLRLSHHLNVLGLSAPRVFGADPSHGLALVEDFGDSTYAACLASGHDEAALYKLAVEGLLHLHRDPKGREVDQPKYDMSVYLDELRIFTDWFVPAIAPEIDKQTFTQSFLALWRDALTPVANSFDTLVLRDFHVDNLMLLEDRTGVARCGLLDFQDGILGPCEYDLVSLLQDARRDLGAGLEGQLLDYYVENAPSHIGAENDIRHRYALLGAQRHARILGVFVRLFQRDAKPRYLKFIPRVLAQFQTALVDADLTAITSFLDAELPGWADKALMLDRDLTTLQGEPDV
ncbi:phosphotransferase [uncultured Shimia sp.]|uniref:aminoglycoside phosphotransferase family protein n=1 Tax=uncultured Shimia sp. TaxID=573152 RepID=UPI0026252BEF|nr:phosphotransferase [uncultured Shimia sp.]